MTRLDEDYWESEDKKTIYREFKNMKLFVDKDGIHRYVVELKDTTKIKRIKDKYNEIDAPTEFIVTDITIPDI